jgi:hypothetical protein
MSQNQISSLRRYWVCAVLCLLLYVGSYAFISRVVARETRRNGVVYYTFIPMALENEHALFYFFAPLIFLDEKLTGRKHHFDVIYS